LVIVTRDRHPLQGWELRVLGRKHRDGAVELLVMLPDGRKTLLPAGFTDAVAAAAEPVLATVGSIEDLGATGGGGVVDAAGGRGRRGGGGYRHSDQGGSRCIR